MSEPLENQSPAWYNLLIAENNDDGAELDPITSPTNIFWSAESSN